MAVGVPLLLISTLARYTLSPSLSLARACTHKTCVFVCRLVLRCRTTISVVCEIRFTLQSDIRTKQNMLSKPIFFPIKMKPILVDPGKEGICLRLHENFWLVGC